MEPWYKVATPRTEVREGRSFNPDEFAIALEQIVAGTAPQDYRDAAQFFARTCFTRALREHAGMVLRSLRMNSPKLDLSCIVLTDCVKTSCGRIALRCQLRNLRKIHWFERAALRLIDSQSLQTISARVAFEKFYPS